MNNEENRDEERKGNKVIESFKSFQILKDSEYDKNVLKITNYITRNSKFAILVEVGLFAIIAIALISFFSLQ